ncbi:DUF308 domain-containing protein [Sulfidibacter corallicola]|uniref:DUF308 domain-containing protein n=1 Tax=Sulfidibacter corallicola TaxID=2818388 RepID=A0A8A4TY29_SULCO|nr:DUF308 domain-containing protein [Sulfidibacter corallicola]QTD54118.1 DUF308 domain-containing protein [Sulfidibacter corallicola]
MGKLLLKEIKALQPFLVLVLLVYCTEAIFELLTDFPDQSPLLNHLTFIQEGSWDTANLFAFFLSFSLASSLLVREVDLRTIHFLDGLPTSRSQVFWAKFWAGFAVLFAGPLVETARCLVQQFFSRTSIDPGFHWNLAGTSLLLVGCQLYIFLSAGLLFSFLRRFGWILAALVFAAYVAIHRVYPAITVWNPCNLTQPLLEGHHWPIPWRMLALQLPVATILLGLAWWLFCGGGLVLANAVQHLRDRSGGRFLLGCSGVLSVVAWVLLLMITIADGDEENGISDQSAVFASWEVARFRTERFTFSFPENLANTIKPNLVDADAAHDRVVSFLAAEPMGVIPVDGSSPAGQHIAGLAFWKSIRISTGTLLDRQRAIATLAHETTHVYANKLSDHVLSEEFESTRFFNEGLAEYVEQRFFSDWADEPNYRLIAAVAHDRKEPDFDTLMNNGALVADFDGNLVYPLGFMFIKALIEQHGDEAPGRILAAMGRADAPSDLQGITLWRDTFQHAGYNFDETINAWYRALQEEAEGLVPELANLPRLYGSIREDGDWVGIDVTTDHDGDYDIHCRVRQNARTDPQEYAYPRADESGTFWVQRADYPQLEFQLGVAPRGFDFPIHEKWTSVTLSR